MVVFQMVVLVSATITVQGEQIDQLDLTPTHLILIGPKTRIDSGCNIRRTISYQQGNYKSKG
jgi:hypothetical protein